MIPSSSFLVLRNFAYRAIAMIVNELIAVRVIAVKEPAGR